MRKIYKVRLLKDLPVYPKDCVFIHGDNGWHGYWDGGDWGIPNWLEELLNNNVPEISDDMHDWFAPIYDEESTVYLVNIRGEVSARNIYNFWGNSDNTAVYNSKEEAQQIANQIKEITKGKNA